MSTANAKSPSAAGGRQLALPDVDPLYQSFEIEDTGDHGEVFTKPWVVDLILDLVGYTPDQPLQDRVLVEPACGSGAFLGPIAHRLSSACRERALDLAEAHGAVRAYDLLPRNVAAARKTVADVLRREGWDEETVESAVMAWVSPRDFLLSHDEQESVDYVVGNPPYIRLEDVPTNRSDAYRNAWPTMTGRSDIFVGFIEKGLSLLRRSGRLGYICADRWMRNQYGSGLRQLVADSYAVDTVITMHDVDAFDSEVSAYPAITILANTPQAEAIVVDTNSSFDAAATKDLFRFIHETGTPNSQTWAFSAARLPHWYSGSESWPQGSPARLKMIEYLADNFAPLEDRVTGTKVGIGVASGADGIYIVDGLVDVEEDRLVPLAMTRDIATGEFKWSGRYLVSPWNKAGLIDLKDYPKLAAYYGSHASLLRKRHVAKRKPNSWYQTIDRVDPDLTGRHKLLLQDMRLTIHPVLDAGTAYPHHNLYYVVSDDWDLKVLGGLLMSDVANAFVEAYAVKMRGGTLRFQAQYLRRIRVPKFKDIPATDRASLTEAFETRNIKRATEVALRLYGLKELAI